MSETDATPVSDSVIVSHSEVESYLSCEKKHYYAFGERLAKPTVPGSLNAMEKGTLGHAVMETFFRWRQDGNSYDDSQQAALDYVRAELHKPEPDFASIMRIEQVTQRFLTDFRERVEDWRVVHIEQTFWLDLDGIKYPFKPDIIYRDETGALTLGDYKFVGQMYSDDLLQLFPQLPKYMGALRAVGVEVRKANYLFFSTNANTKPVTAPLDSVCRISNVVINNDRLRNSWYEQIAATHRIANVKKQDLETWERNALRSTNKDCGWCTFKRLCATTLQGSDGLLMRQHEFIPNTYGYREDIREEETK